MGIAERKEKQKLEIRKMILDASMKLFVEEGFEQVSIRRIAELIEYSPTTVYLYFKDKDEIFFNLHELGFEKLQEMNQDLDQIENPLLQLYQMGKNYLEFGMKNPEFYNLMFIHPEPMDKLEEMGEEEWINGDNAMNRLKKTVKAAMDGGYIAEDSVDLVSMSVWSLVHGLVSLAVRERLEKFVPEKAMVMPVMQQSLNWLMRSLDLKGVIAIEGFGSPGPILPGCR